MASVTRTLPSPYWGRPGEMPRRPKKKITSCGFETALISPSFSYASRRSDAKKTKVKRKTNNPQFEEVFYFEVCLSYFSVALRPCMRVIVAFCVVYWWSLSEKEVEEEEGGSSDEDRRKCLMLLKRIKVKHLRLFLQFLGYFGQTVYWRVTILTRGSIFVQNDLVCIQWLLNSVIWHCDPAT